MNAISKLQNGHRSIRQERYAASPELRARIDGAGAASLAQSYTSKAKYDPDVFRRDSAKLAALLAAKHFLP